LKPVISEHGADISSDAGPANGLHVGRDETVQHLRNLVLREWEQFKQSANNGASPSKEELRQKHLANRLEILERDRAWIASHAHRLLVWFASGADVIPARISPRLVPVETNEQQDLFRLARYTWSLPYSKGYGRRLKFLIIDDSNGKLMGVLGLQSPPLDLSPRDQKFAFAPGRKVELVNQTMDIYVQGAVPPYNVLLGGKLVVMAVAAREVRQAYRHRYEGKLTQMEGKQLPPHLVAVTTTSAFGRSSLYNRVVFEKDGQRHKVAESLGFMRGFGVFQFSEATYQLLKEFIRQELPSRKVAGFATGPRVKWQVITLALHRLGVPTSTMRHGIQREAYLVRLVDNLEAYFSGEEHVPKYLEWDFSELAAFWKRHYLLGPRRQRPQHWRQWDRGQILKLVLPEALSTTRPS
jgi:hypothetical protein